MGDIIEAIYEGGVLKPVRPLDISEYTRVRISIEPQGDAVKNAEEVLALARQSCEGLSKDQLTMIESARLRSKSFFH